MNREVHVRFWESPEVKVLRATRHSLPGRAASKPGDDRYAPKADLTLRAGAPLRGFGAFLHCVA